MMRLARRFVLPIVGLFAGLLVAQADTVQPERTEDVLALKRGKFTVFRYVPAPVVPAVPPKRYGLRFPDRCDVSPTVAGTFALTDFGHSLDRYRVAQWNGGLDIMGSKSWLASLTAPHKSYDFPYGLHDYNGASDYFLKGLKESLVWILTPARSPDTPDKVD